MALAETEGGAERAYNGVEDFVKGALHGGENAFVVFAPRFEEDGAEQGGEGEGDEEGDEGHDEHGEGEGAQE